MRGKLMRLFTREQHLQILGDFAGNKDAARVYSAAGNTTVTPELVRYWRRIFLDNKGNQPATDRALAGNRVLRSPQPDDDLGDLSFIPEVAQSILVIGDIHAPYHHPDLLAFVKEVRDTFAPDLVVQIGDELDYHALSFHDSDPNLDSAGAELAKGRKFLEQLHAQFPNILVCHSNHGSMVHRKAKVGGIPVQMLKRYRDTIFPKHGAPGWSWAYSWHVETPMGTVMFKHQKSGNLLSDAAHNRCNLVVGHEHGLFGVEYAASSHSLYFGANTGCLIDRQSLAFAYGKHFPKKPIIGCLVILAGRPCSIPMLLKDNGRWVGHL